MSVAGSSLLQGEGPASHAYGGFRLHHADCSGNSNRLPPRKTPSKREIMGNAQHGRCRRLPAAPRVATLQRWQKKNLAGSGFITSPLGRAHVAPGNCTAVAGMVLPRHESMLAQTKLADAIGRRSMDVPCLAPNNYRGCFRHWKLLRLRC